MHHYIYFADVSCFRRRRLTILSTRRRESATRNFVGVLNIYPVWDFGALYYRRHLTLLTTGKKFPLFSCAHLFLPVSRRLCAAFSRLRIDARWKAAWQLSLSLSPCRRIFTLVTTLPAARRAPTACYRPDADDGPHKEIEIFNRAKVARTRLPIIERTDEVSTIDKD